MGADVRKVYTLPYSFASQHIKTYSWNIGDPQRLNPYTRAIFIATNFPFFLTFLKKRSKQSSVVMLIGLLSSAYHSHQCCCMEGINRIHTAKLKWADILLTTPLGCYIVAKNWRKINMKIVLASLISLACYTIGFKKRTLRGQYRYMFFHGIWHLLNGYVFHQLIEEPN
jgi:hypothetical protein